LRFFSIFDFDLDPEFFINNKMIDVISTSISLIRLIIQVREDVKYNKKQCHRLIARLSRIIPILESWKVSHHQHSEEKDKLMNDKYYCKTFVKFYDFLKEIQSFLDKFLDRNYFMKVIQRNKDLETFDEYNKDLQNYVDELQLGISFNIKECQEEDCLDRSDDLAEIKMQQLLRTNK